MIDCDMQWKVHNMGIFDLFYKNKPKIDGISAQIIKQRDSMKKNGFKHYVIIANKNCCDVCAAMNGKHFPVSELVIGVNAPPMHDGCRCSISAWEDPDEYEAWLDHLANGGSTKKRKQK